MMIIDPFGVSFLHFWHYKVSLHHSTAQRTNISDQIWEIRHTFVDWRIDLMDQHLLCDYLNRHFIIIKCQRLNGTKTKTCWCVWNQFRKFNALLYMQQVTINYQKKNLKRDFFPIQIKLLVILKFNSLCDIQNVTNVFQTFWQLQFHWI